METNGLNGSAPKVIVQYGSFIFALVCFTCVAAGGLFFLVWATAQGSAYAFDANKVSLIGLISTGLWASRAWAAIKRAEPDAIPTFRQKHRAFQIKAGTAIVGVIACAAMAGIYFGNRAAHKNKLGLLTKEVSDLGSKAAPIKQRFIQLRSETAQDLPGYLRRCSELEATLNDYEPALKQMDSLMSETQQELEELKTDSEYAEALPMVVVMRSVLKKDIEVAATYRKEIAYA